MPVTLFVGTVFVLTRPAGARSDPRGPLEAVLAQREEGGVVCVSAEQEVIGGGF